MRSSLTFERLSTAVFFLAIAVVACLAPAQSDTWWQLRTGQEIWQTHAIDLRDHFSHTVSGSYWPNHEWLSQVLFYGIYHVGGLPLLTAFCAAVITAAWMAAWRLTSGNSLRCLMAGALGIAASSGGWSLRPQVLTFLAFATTAFLLVRRRYAPLPVLFLVWANLHGGVVLGFPLIGAAIFDLAVRERRFPLRLTAVAAACVLATALTPLGFSFWAEIPASLKRLHDYRVLEWQSPRLANPQLLPFWLLVVALVALVVSAKPWRRGSSGSNVVAWMALAMLPLAISSARNIPPFVLVAFPAITVMWEQRFPQRRTASKGVEHPALNAALLSGGVVLGAIAVAYAWSVQLPRLGWHPLSTDLIAALDACPDQLYNRYDEGGYLIWFVRGRKVFLDSRQDPFPPDLIHAQIRAERSGDYQRLFDRYSIHCALLPQDSPVAQRLTASGWAARYQDRGWIVFAH